jgi:hypothetical protein
VNLVSPTVFDWIITAITGGVAGAWLVYDAINLWRARGLDRADAKVRDRHFGYVMGMVIGVLGVLGTLHYHGVW